jgi:thiamine-monophosphate kinase
MPAWVVVGPGDDAAVLEPERGTLDVVTTDASVEGVHFDRRFVPPGAVGHRAAAVNLSDLAAMGAQPRALLLSLVLPDSLTIDELDALVDGFLAAAAPHKAALVGGNITRSTGPLVVDVTAIGSVRRRNVLRRAGARPGDSVYVTGRVGCAEAGLELLQKGGGIPDALQHAAAAYLRPEPRVRAGVLLARNRCASSCMDLSDGLADAVRQVAEASGVGMVIDGRAVPLDAAVRTWQEEQGREALERALVGGDDYELLFTVRPSKARRFRGVLRVMGTDLPITRIGMVTKDRQLRIEDGSGGRELPQGYEHFR